MNKNLAKKCNTFLALCTKHHKCMLMCHLNKTPFFQKAYNNVELKYNAMFYFFPIFT